jgi:hypothetical protein
MAAAIAAITGAPLPEVGPRPMPEPLVFVYAADPIDGDLVFMPLESALRHAPVAVAAEVAGTWRDFFALAGRDAMDLWTDLSRRARYRNFDDYQLQRILAAPHGRRRSAEALRKAYTALACPRNRPPERGEPVSREGLRQLALARRSSFYDPNLEMEQSMPMLARQLFEHHHRDAEGRALYPAYEARHLDGLVGVFREDGHTLVNDDFLVGCFRGRVRDPDAVRRRVSGYRDPGELEQLLADGRRAMEA